MNGTKNFWQRFKREKAKENSPETGHESNLKKQVQAFARNGIFFDFERGDITPRQSKFGGKPALPKGFEWPRSTNEYDEDAPLPFLLQLNCEELAPYDTDNRLPHEGMFYLFYDLVGQPWRGNEGVQLLYTPTPASELEAAEFPDDLPENLRLFEMGFKFTNRDTIPCWDDYFSILGNSDSAYSDWDIIEQHMGTWGYPHVDSAGRILGYASLIQNGIAETCESRARGDKQENYCTESAREWILLLQLDCVEEEEVDIPFGDCGSIYFYIRQRDLERRDFSQIQFELQCY